MFTKQGLMPLNFETASTEEVAIILSFFIPEAQYHILLEISKFFSNKQLDDIEAHLTKFAQQAKENKSKSTKHYDELNKLFDPLVLGMRSG